MCVCVYKNLDELHYVIFRNRSKKIEDLTNCLGKPQTSAVFREEQQGSQQLMKDIQLPV